MRKVILLATAPFLFLNGNVNAHVTCPSQTDIAAIVTNSDTVKDFVKGIGMLGFNKASFSGDITANIMTDPGSDEAALGLLMLKKNADNITLNETLRSEEQGFMENEETETKGPNKEFKEEMHEKKHECIYDIKGLSLIFSKEKEKMITD